MSRALVAFDTDRIKNYVFSTGLLKEIVGGSALIDDFNRRQMFALIREEDPSAEKIYADAGAGLFMVAREKADEIIIGVEKAFRKETVTGSISGVWVPYDQNIGFQEQFAMLTLRLRASKAGKLFRYMPPGACSLTKTCTSCGNEYAQQKVEQKGAAEATILEEEFLCATCQRKREKDQGIKKSLAMLLQGKRAYDALSLWDRLIKRLKEQLPPDQQAMLISAQTPESFNELAQLSSPANYIALIYVDGDNFGNRMGNFESITEVQEFSEIVDSSLLEALLYCVKKYLLPEHGCFPFNLLFHGGDDLMLATTAEKGVKVARDLCSHFARITKDRNFPLTLSASVTIARGRHPFANLLKLAEASLSFAKNSGAQKIKANPNMYEQKGFINFQVIHSSNSYNFQEEYEHIYTTVSGDSILPRKLIRTLRPYTCDELEILLTLIEDYRDFPRNKLYALQENLFEEYNSSVLDTMAIISRLSLKNRRKVHTALGSFAHPDSKCIPPWISLDCKNENLASPFMDIIELYTFTERRREY